jgi:two-component system, NtrC family, sensor kinase
MILGARHITQTLAFRLFVLIAGIQMIVMTALAFATISIHSSHLRDHVLMSAVRISDLMVRSTRHSMLRNDKGEMQEILRAIGDEPGIHGLRIMNKDGRVIFAADTAELHLRVTKQDAVCKTCHRGDSIRQGPYWPGDTYDIQTQADGQRTLRLVTPILNEPSCTSVRCHAHEADKSVLGILDVRMSMAVMDASLAESRNQFLALAAAGVLVVAFVSGGFLWWFVRRPVRFLIDGMETVTAGNLDKRLPVRSADELGQLAETFNEMTEELTRARAEITEWSGTLEVKVQEKTADLERIHRRMLSVEKMASLGNLAASVAHEINNPLEGILTFAKLSIKRLQRLALPPEERTSLCDDLQLVADEAQRCGSIVKNMLLFARPQPAAFDTVALGTILERCRMLVQHYAEMHNVEISVVSSPDDEISCDPGQIQQVVMVLMINGIEAIALASPRPATAFLSVDARPVPGKELMRIRVADTGIGMTEEVRTRIFEPFFTTKTDGRSVGLGLAIAYGIIGRHHGSIEVETAPGAGSTFTVLLPRRQPSASESDLSVAG